mgnify:CR=1 FL=1
MAKKITRKQLSRVIREEVRKVISEDENEFGQFQPERAGASKQMAHIMEMIAPMAKWWLGEKAFLEAKEGALPRGGVRAQDAMASASMPRASKYIGVYGGFLGWMGGIEAQISALGRRKYDATRKSLKISKLVITKLEESLDLYKTLFQSIESMGEYTDVKADGAALSNHMNRLDKVAERTLRQLNEDKRRGQQLANGDYILKDPRALAALVTKCGEVLIQTIGELAKYVEDDALRRLTPDQERSREAAQDGYQPYGYDEEDLNESKKPSNQLILENHRRGRGVHPAVQSRWWYGDK